MAIICIPKQPSTELVPSKGDLRIVERLVEVVKFLRIPVQDHVILDH